MLRISITLMLLAMASFFVVQTIDNRNQNQAINQAINQQTQLIAEIEESNLSNQLQSEQSNNNQQNLLAKSDIALATDSNKIKRQTATNNSVELVDFSDLNIKLLATAEIGKNKVASISYDNQNDFYQLNQFINPQLKLSAIERSFVIIDYQNQSYRLDVLDQTTNFQSGSFDLVQQPVEPVKKQLIRFQKMIQVDPYALVGVIGIKNYQKSGIKGYQLNANIDKTLFRELGLQDGDVVVEINRMSVTSGMNLKQIYQDLITKKQFVIKVVRDGRQLEYLLNLS